MKTNEQIKVTITRSENLYLNLAAGKDYINTIAKIEGRSFLLTTGNRIKRVGDTVSNTVLDNDFSIYDVTVVLV